MLYTGLDIVDREQNRTTLTLGWGLTRTPWGAAVQMMPSAVMLLGAIVVTGCGGSGGPAPLVSPSPEAGNVLAAGPGTDASTNPATSPSSSVPSPVAMVVAYPQPPTGLLLDDLNDNGHAAGVTAYTTPLSVSANNYHLATAGNFSPLPAPTKVGRASNNDAGVMAGTATDAFGGLFHWRWNGAQASAVPQPADKTLTLASVIGIDNRDRVAAVVYDAQGRWQVASVDGAGRYTLMPELAGTTSNVYYYSLAVSNGGVVAGEANNNDGSPARIFAWSPGSAPRVVFTDNAGICGCSVRSVNDHAQVLLDVQTVYAVPGDSGGTLRSPAYGLLASPGSVQRLPTVNGSMNYWGLNNAGQAVGSDGVHAMWLVGGELRNLNAYTNAASLGWDFKFAKLINNSRQIVGTGTFNGQERWFLLSLK